MTTLDVLVVADPHAAAHPEPPRRGELATALLAKAIHRLTLDGTRPDLVILLGDIVEDGDQPDAAAHMEALAGTLRRANIPVLAVPGNHDGDPARVAALFATPPGLHEIGGYGFYVFHDRAGAGGHTTRTAEALSDFRAAARARPGLPLVALQHNPLLPVAPSGHGDASDYPYTLTHAGETLAAYDEAGAILSLSGHVHAAQPPTLRGRLTLYTAPALCEPPFRFAHLRLRGDRVEIRETALRLPEPNLTDVHCHTEFAYCATTVSATLNIPLAEALGLGRLCLTEHAFHLYFNEADAWSYRWQTDPSMVREAWQTRSGRMAAYKAFIRPRRGGFVRLGIETDLLADGRLLLAPEDADGWDLLLGAVHAIPGFVQGRTTQEQAEALFMEQVDGLLAHPIQVLAHPFRFFRRAGLRTPCHLYGPVADRLRAAEVAAEVNFHANVPDPVFLRACLDRGVRLALGTDSHDQAEVAELTPHLRVLREAGLTGPDLAARLWRPD